MRTVKILRLTMDEYQKLKDCEKIILNIAEASFLEEMEEEQTITDNLLSALEELFNIVDTELD